MKDRRRSKPGDRLPAAWWLPVAFFVAGTAAILAVWGSARRADERVTKRETHLTADQVRLRLEAWVDARIAIVNHLALFSGARTGDRAAFAEEARALVASSPGLQALNLVDAEGVIRVIVPEAGNEAALGKNLHAHPDLGVREAIARAQGQAALVSTPVIALLQGGTGVATYQAVSTTDARNQGFINGVFRINGLVDACLAEKPLRARYRFQLREGSAIAYRHDPSATQASAEWPFVVSVPLRIIDRTWFLDMAPSPRALAARKNPAQDLLAAVGVGLAGLLALLLAARLRNEAALAESKARYRLLVENAADLIVKVDAQGRLLYVSPSYCETFGMMEAELLGREFMPLVHEDDRESTARAMRQLETPPHTCYLEQRVMTAKGLRWFSWSDKAVLDGAGRVEAIIGVGHDITRRRELEEQLLQAQKIQAIGELAGGVAHDFNNILQAMLGFLGLVLDSLPPDDPNRADLEHVQAGGERAAQLTRQLLAFSRRQVMQFHDVDLNELVAHFLGMLQRMVGEAVELDFRRAPSALPVHVDSGQIEQILINLCVNARDALGGTGVVRVATGVATPDAAFCARHPGASQREYATLSVADSGTGMSEETRAHIFEPFFTTKGVGAGTGLGLSMVHGIVQQHGGLLDVWSQLGVGTRFTVYLPRATSISEPPNAPETPAVPRSEGVVLVAEDDVDVRAFVSRVLRSAGYAVLEAADGREAVRLVTERYGAVDVVLLDIVMPGMNGREAARCIREVAPKVRILFSSGYDPESASGAELGAISGSVLIKPFDAHTLLRTVSDARLAGMGNDGAGPRR